MAERDYFAHPTAVIDDGCVIGKGTKIWHFSHVMPKCVIGEDCNIGQNVVISPEVILGRNVKVQNNVSIYTGVECEDDVFLGPSMVFTNVTNPRSAVNRKNQYARTMEMELRIMSHSIQMLMQTMLLLILVESIIMKQQAAME
jgi:UDP-2-acetamido-3-amino-2,3-dideoxy-glucuronate N-acetyltransferase